MAWRGPGVVLYRSDMGGRWVVPLGLGLLLAAPVLAAPPPPPRLPRPHSSTLRTDAVGPQLRPQDDGTLRHLDTEARFVGVIHPDGRVELRDLPDVKREFTVGVRGVDWMLGLAHAITRSGTHDRPELEQPVRDGDPSARRDAATVIVPEGPYGPAPILLGIGGRFGGVGDRLLRRGQRKQAQAKQDFLERTEALREALARTHVQAQQRAAQLRLGQELAASWNDRARSAADRKRELFERWDECEEALADGSETDLARASAGEAVRRRIEAFARQVAPPGSREAFTADELARLNAGRHSRQRFDPYASRDELHEETRDDPAAAGIVAR